MRNTYKELADVLSMDRGRATQVFVVACSHRKSVARLWLDTNYTLLNKLKRIQDELLET